MKKALTKNKSEVSTVQEDQWFPAQVFDETESEELTTDSRVRSDIVGICHFSSAVFKARSIMEDVFLAGIVFLGCCTKRGFT